jgi:alkanesulfonate monooxygenase SsuD/methylene tetrahydromethanopterin reductase-like flavin-dependent oxidoreductase (luciferase family)
VPAGQAKAIYAETLDALTRAWRTGRLDHRGTLLRSYDATLAVLPKQRPYPPLWYASSNTKTARWAGEHGVNFVGRWNGGTLAGAVEEYWSAWSANRDAADRLNGHVEHPSVGLAATVVIAPTDAEAEDTYLRAHAVFGSQLTHLWHQHGDHQVDRMADGAAALRAGAACVGSAATVRDQIVHQVRHTGANFFQLLAFFGDLTSEEAHRTLRTFMTEVAPTVRAEATPRHP